MNIEESKKRTSNEEENEPDRSLKKSKIEGMV